MSKRLARRRNRSHRQPNQLDPENAGRQQDPGIPIFEQVAAENRGENRNNTYQCKHRNYVDQRHYTSNSLIGRLGKNLKSTALPLDSLGERAYRTPKGLRKEA